jgi:5-methylcytosine-specific restriction endonuclease McrBC regulatory subunit McrC
VERALSHLRVEHGTHAAQTAWLLSSVRDPNSGLGRLKPDVLAYDGDNAAVVADTKYKRLQERWPERPHGVDRADL